MNDRPEDTTADKGETEPVRRPLRYENLRIREHDILLTFRGPRGGLSSIPLYKADMPRLVFDCLAAYGNPDYQRGIARQVREQNKRIARGDLSDFTEVTDDEKAAGGLDADD